MRRIGILGGTFDPIHIGHLILAEEARVILQLDVVLFIPAAQPWRKAGRDITAAADRLEMVRLAIQDNPSFRASSIEIDRSGLTYTVDTLDALRATFQDAGFWFILGADALMDLPNWKEPGRILSLARLAVASRASTPLGNLEELNRYLPGVGSRVDQVPMPSVSISSSELRRRLREGTSTRYWLPEAVRRYAVEHRLYGVGMSRPVPAGS